MKSYFFCLATMLLALAGFNYWADTGRVWGSYPGPEPPFHLGSQVLALNDYDAERPLKRMMALTAAEGSEVVLGSSHAGDFSSDMWKGQAPISNLWMIAAQPEEQIALLQVLLENGRRHSLLWVIDPWLFSSGTEFPWHFFAMDYLRAILKSRLPAVKKIQLACRVFSPLSARLEHCVKDLIGLGATERSLDKLLNWTAKPWTTPSWRIVPSQGLAHMVPGTGLAMDGSIYDHFDAADGIDSRMKKMLELYRGSAEQDALRVALIKDLLMRAHRAGWKIQLLVPPLSPSYLSLLAAGIPDPFPGLEGEVRSLVGPAAADSALFFLSSAPACCSRKEFYDQEHFNKDCARRLLNFFKVKKTSLRLN